MQHLRIRSITEFHRLANLSKPAHPLISVLDLDDFVPPVVSGDASVMIDLYSIALKRVPNVRFKYGQQSLDFDEGVLFCTAPGQVFSFEVDETVPAKASGWMILIHPDFLWNTPLAKGIKQYEYFNYRIFEALHLSDREETMLNELARQIKQEYYTNIDRFSQQVIIAQLELMLTYTERFYHRQFITRKKVNHEILTRLEDFLATYFNSDTLAKQGLPTVTHIAEQLHVSPSYLTGLLKTLTGQSTQQHLHEKIIALAKEKLTTTDLTVSEISYQLGFEHLASFSKLFKSKTNLSPLEFRRSFNE